MEAKARKKGESSRYEAWRIAIPEYARINFTVDNFTRRVSAENPKKPGRVAVSEGIWRHTNDLNM